MRTLSRLGLLLAALLFSGHALACNTPNPNLSAPPFVDGCDVPAAALNNLAQSVTPMSYGALGNGVWAGTGTDYSAALQNWFNYGSAGHPITLPCGTYTFASPLTLTGNNVSLKGAGASCTNLRYVGSSTTATPITFGTVGATHTWLHLEGFRVSSNTRMTYGSCAFVAYYNNVKMIDVDIDSQQGDGNCWNGVSFENVTSLYRSHFDDRAQNDVDQCFGVGSGTPAVDVRFNTGKISLGTIGLHQGGGCGGVSIGANVDVIANTQNVVVDNALSSLPNTELTTDASSFLDTPGEDNIVINNTVSAGGGQEYQLHGWIASAPRYGVDVKTCGGSACIVDVEGGPLYGNAVAAVQIETTVGTFIIGPNVPIYANAGGAGDYAINCTVSHVNLLQGGSPTTNGFGGIFNYSPNCFVGGTWTPTLAFATGGSVTYLLSLGDYSFHDGYMDVGFNIQLNGVSSPTGFVTITGLPASCPAATANGGRPGNYGLVSYVTGLSGWSNGTLFPSSGGGGSATINLYGVTTTGVTPLGGVNLTSSTILAGRMMCPLS